jgi:hypothetical protein
MKYRLLRTPTDGHRIVVIHRKQTTRSDSSYHAGRRHPGASLLAILGLNVRHDLDIEPATRSVSSLPGNVCLRCSDGLQVACQFESHPLRQRVCDVERFGVRSTKSARVPRLVGLKSTREILTGEIFASLARILSVSTFGGGLWNIRLSRSPRASGRD